MTFFSNKLGDKVVKRDADTPNYIYLNKPREIYVFSSLRQRLNAISLIKAKVSLNQPKELLMLEQTDKKEKSQKSSFVYIFFNRDKRISHTMDWPICQVSI